MLSAIDRQRRMTDIFDSFKSIQVNYLTIPVYIFGCRKTKRFETRPTC